MKPASARRISSHADGPDVARARGRPATSAPNGPISFGAICPAKGKGAGLVMPWCDTDAMAAHLIEISDAVDPGAHAVLIVDQAGWHLTPKLAIPDNITVLALPPTIARVEPGGECLAIHARQLVVEPDLQILRRHRRAVLPSFWNNLIDQPWKIMSLGMRKWAHGF